MPAACNGQVRRADRYALGIAPAASGDGTFFVLCAQHFSSRITLERAESYGPDADHLYVAERVRAAYRRARARHHVVPVYVTLCRWWVEPAQLAGLESALRTKLGPFARLDSMSYLEEEHPHTPAQRALSAALEKLEPDVSADLYALAEEAEKRATWYT